MKKYHQLLLLITSIISLALFLIYRHEYNRLHYVLEVFNFFGQPCNFSDLQIADFTLKQRDWGPEPIWQETDSGYIYSAFLTGKMKVKAIALPKDIHKLPKSCFFWLEDNRKPVAGKLTFSKIEDHQSVSPIPYFYYCSGRKEINNIPYAVSFTSNLKSEVKKILLTDISNNKVANNNITICVSPSAFSKKKFVEFFSFHRLIGVESFIFYNKDMPHRLTKLMKNMSKRLDVQISFLLWNFPKNDEFTDIIIENDCLLRTYGQSRFVTTLEFNEYIVPTYSFSINDIIKELKEKRNKLSLPIQKFCINYVNIKEPFALQNYDVVNDINYNAVKNIYKNINSTESVAHISDKTGASIHKYVKCENNVKTTKDYSMKKFSLDFIRSTLVQLLIHNQL